MLLREKHLIKLFALALTFLISSGYAFLSGTDLSPVAMAADGMTPVGPKPNISKDNPFKVMTEAYQVGPGSGAVRVSIWFYQSDHYIYENKTSVEGGALEGVVFQAVKTPKSKRKYDPNFDEEVSIYEGTPTFELPFTYTDALKGSVEIPIVVRYQGCNPSQCFFPKTEEISVKFDLGGAGALPPKSAKAEGKPEAKKAETAGSSKGDSGSASVADADGGDFFSTDIGEAAGESIFLALLLAFGAGVLTSLTPCVYPVIPITLRVLGASQADGKFQAFTLAFTYVMGMALVYAGLGVAAAATGGVFGAWLQHPVVLGVLVAIFVAMGFSMLGAFDLALPSGISTKLQSVEGRGYPGALLAGAVAGIVVGPCSAPVLVSLLGYIANSGNMMVGSLLMFAYALGIGVLFLILGTFAASVQMPRSGAWMETTKSVLALMIFGVALYYLSFLVEGGWYALIVGASAIVAGTFIGAFNPLSWDDGWGLKIRKAAGILAVVTGLLLVVDGLLQTQLAGQGLALRAPATASQNQTPEIAWVRNEAKGLEMARAKGQAVVIDFTAKWCGVCQEIKHEVFQNETVIAQMDNVVPILVDGTKHDDPQFNALKSKYQVTGLPKIVFISPTGEILEDLTVTSMISKEEFLKRLEKTTNAT